jgi:hypothetical protein
MGLIIKSIRLIKGDGMKKGMVVLCLLTMGFGVSAIEFNPDVLGDFDLSCYDIYYHEDSKMLSCNCKNERGELMSPRSYYLGDCVPGSVQNVNGIIGCDCNNKTCPMENDKPFCRLD